MKFRKKPIVIDAIQVPMSGTVSNGVYPDKDSKTGLSIDTLEGKCEVTRGDWIITGIEGEKYPCKPNIFKKTYERV